MNPHQIPLAVAALALGAGVWSLLDLDLEQPRVRSPEIADTEAVRHVSLDLPPIRAFAHYYGRRSDPWQKLNPFVPAEARARERARLVEQEEEDARPPSEEYAVLPEPPENEAKPDEPTLAELPRITAGRSLVPRVVGYIEGEGRRRIAVRFGEAAAVPLAPGERHAGWTLIAIDGQQAIFTDADGVRQGFTIGGERPLATVLAADESGDDGGTGAGDAAPSAAEIIRMMQADPRGRRLLRDNPGLRKRIEENPERFIEMFRDRNR